MDAVRSIIKTWQDSERKQAIIEELAAEGVIWQALDQLGTPLEIVKNAFGCKKEYEQAITALEAALYSSEKYSA